MAVVINAKGTSVTQFQIGKQGPIIKNNSGVIEFKDSTDTDLQVQILSTANAVNNLTLTGSTTGNDATIAVVGTDTNINIKLEPKGTGQLVLDGLNWPTVDGTANQVLTTDGAGALSFASTYLGAFTVAGLPTASANTNALALATDASGGRTLVISDGTNWKVFATEGATVA